jgi:hypothetical protein
MNEPGRAVGSRRIAIAKIKAEAELPEVEENRGDDRADPDIAPADDHVGQVFENRGEENGRDTDCDHEIDDVEQEFHLRRERLEIVAKRSERGAHA